MSSVQDQIPKRELNQIRKNAPSESKGAIAGKDPAEEGIRKTTGKMNAARAALFVAAAGMALSGCYRVGAIVEEGNYCECGDTDCGEDAGADSGQDAGDEECTGPKNPASVQMGTQTIMDNVTGTEFTERMFADSETAENYVGGLPEGDGWTLRYEFGEVYGEGLFEQFGDNLFTRIDRHGLEILFAGELWEIAEISSEDDSIALGRRIFTGYVGLSTPGELPAGLKLVVSEVDASENENGEHQVQIGVQNEDGETLVSVLVDPGEIALLDLGELKYWVKVNQSNYNESYTEDGAMVSVYSKFTFLNNGENIGEGKAFASIEWGVSENGPLLNAFEAWAPTCEE